MKRFDERKRQSLVSIRNGLLSYQTRLHWKTKVHLKLIGFKGPSHFSFLGFYLFLIIVLLD